MRGIHPLAASLLALSKGKEGQEGDKGTTEIVPEKIFLALDVTKTTTPQELMCYTIVVYLILSVLFCTLIF
jgi:hypothetical protein